MRRQSRSLHSYLACTFRRVVLHPCPTKACLLADWFVTQLAFIQVVPLGAYGKTCFCHSLCQTCLQGLLFTCSSSFSITYTTCSFTHDTCVSWIGKHVPLCTQPMINGLWRSRPFISISYASMWVPLVSKVLLPHLWELYEQMINNLPSCITLKNQNETKKQTTKQKQHTKPNTKPTNQPNP